ncbi:probable ubiquitin carboxyl-terminal hydrolase MINDY-4 [Portunus trituberculatus]|uniref:probable ubiquitin carboxyl-terminal hydrolase MINDY-4 n=1 Tax=Portunus trituberculatus TaxID=210409 RepID=UPI001E1D06BE|nr:probable ubiquitin carboxyl-terminal hydrolase MINDY-4 [Portunus trituberculatus]
MITYVARRRPMGRDKTPLKPIRRRPRPHRMRLSEEAGVGDVAATRQGTQEASPRGQRLWPGGGEDPTEGSPELLKINTHNSGLKTGRHFDHGLDTFRSHSIEIENGLQSPLASHRNGHIPNGVRNGSLAALRVPPHGGFRNSSGVALAVHGRSEFDTDADVDIATMAAQRDQLRGARNVRGMMAPVMSKEDDPRTRSANRKMLLTKQRSESVLEGQDEVDEKGGRPHPAMEQEDRNRGEVLGGINRRGTFPNGQGKVGGLGGIAMRPMRDYLDTSGRGDIMAQSMRRQSLRGSKLNLFEGNYNHFDSNGGSRLSMESSDEHVGFRQDDDSYAEAKRKNLPKFIPSSHEDIQILNLQGFMDASGFMDDGRSSSRRKSKKKRMKRAMEGGDGDKERETYKFNAKPRRKRTHRLSKNHLSDDDGEMVLKDVDDLDKQVAGLVLGPETGGKETAGRPITLEEASQLRNLLTGSPAQPLSTEWLSQNFKQNANPNLSYGIVQKKGGPCGVLACVQAYMMKSLIFGTSIAPTTSPVSPLRPSQREWLWSLAVAITEILWKAGQGEKAILAMPGSFAHFTEHGVGRYSQDGMTENLTLHEFVEQRDLYDAVTRHLTAFTSETSSGCVVLLYSLILTRGIENIQGDMDPGGGHLINSHGYSSQEIVNLLLTGRAFTNTFNGEHKLGGNTPQQESMVLRGITQKAEIGLLSLFEHYDCYKVGTHLKTPQYPIWVVCCESHYSCLFSRDTSVTSDTPPITTFDIYYYDGLALQEDEIRLTIELSGEESDLPIVPPLEHCIRTKWKAAAVNWNGTDPIL